MLSSSRSATDDSSSTDSSSSVIATRKAAPFKVFDGIMVPYQTPVRRSLVDWASEIHDRFYAAREQVKANLVEGAGPIVNCFNEAALIEVYFGRQELAGTLCSSCIQWFYRHAQTPATSVILQYAFEPYLNLARLDRMALRFEEALQKIQIIKRVACGQEAWMGDVFIPAALCRDIFSRSTPLPRLIRTAYILEWVKALIKCKRYQEAEEFNPAWQSPADLTARDILWESKIIALCYLGRYEDALTAGNPALSDRQGLNRMLFLFRRAETFAAAGRIDDALRVSGSLASGFLNYPRPLSMTRLGLLIRLTSLLANLGAPNAQRLAEVGYKSATSLGDMLFQSEFLNLMADLQGEAGAEARSEAGHIRRSGCYGSAHTTIQKCTVIEALSEDLLSFVKYD